MMFWLIAILLGLIGSAFILAPLLLGRSRTYRDQRADINLSLYLERINDLKVGGHSEEVAALELEAKKALLSDTALVDCNPAWADRQCFYSCAAVTWAFPDVQGSASRYQPVAVPRTDQ